MEPNSTNWIYIKLTLQSESGNNTLYHDDLLGEIIPLKLKNADESFLIVAPLETDNSLYLTTVTSFYIEKIGLKRYQTFQNNKGNILSILGGGCPNTIAEFFKEKIPGWVKENEKIFRIIRWRLDNFSTSAHAECKVEWTIDPIEENMWSEIVFDRDEVYVGKFLNSMPQNVPQEIQKLIENDFDEPIYINLIKEAESQLNSNRRSCLVLIILALEIGLKTIISKLSPASEWLIYNVQSPPVVHLLRDYIPLIASDFKINEKNLKEIENVVKERNDLVHKGVYKLSGSQLYSRFITIKNLLHECDRIMGHEWAVNHRQGTNSSLPD